MQPTDDTQAPKQPASLRLDSGPVAKAPAEGLSAPATAADSVAAERPRQTRKRWDAEVAAACAAHDRYLEQYGSLGEILRKHNAAGNAD